MPVGTCPDCNYEPVSSSANSCPKCGCTHFWIKSSETFTEECFSCKGTGLDWKTGCGSCGGEGRITFQNFRHALTKEERTFGVNRFGVDFDSFESYRPR